MQMIFAGKAHPNDEDGKRLIQQVYNLAKDPAYGGRIAFVEDYDMHIARDLVRGVDVWLNTSTRADGSQRHQRAESIPERRFEFERTGRLVV